MWSAGCRTISLGGGKYEAAPTKLLRAIRTLSSSGGSHSTYFPSQVLLANFNEPDATAPGTYTNAFGSGGVCLSSGQWFQRQWTPEKVPMDVCVKELIGSLQAITLWSSDWAGKTVQVDTDNSVVVAYSKRRTSRTNGMLVELFRYLFVIKLKYRCRISFKHIFGARNILADALSRND